MEEEKKQDKKHSGFSLLNPTLLHETLKSYCTNDSIKHIMIFQNIEGSIVAKASSPSILEAQRQHEIQFGDDAPDPQRALNSYAAVLANTCHEYIEFGFEAFDNNKFKQITIQHENSLLMICPIFKSRVGKDQQSQEAQDELQIEEGLLSSENLLLLCFICDVNCNLGFVSRQFRNLSDQIA